MLLGPIENQLKKGLSLQSLDQLYSQMHTSTESDSPLVSTIIPAYNRPHRTERAIQSVVEQTHKPIELIVVDDGSTPPLRDSISLEYDSLEDFQLIEHETNRGANTARNTGIKASTGTYLAFLDSDDEWSPNKIAKQITQLRASPSQVGLVYTGVRQLNAKGETNSVSCPEYRGDVSKQLLKSNFIGTFSSIMVRSSVFDRVGSLDERFPSWQDWEFYLRLAREYEFETLPEPLVNRHNEGDQISRDYRQKRDETIPLFLEKFEPMAKSYGRLFRRQWRGKVAYHLALSALRNKNYTEGRQWIFNALRWYPAIPKAYIHLLFLMGGEKIYEWGRQTKRKLVRALE